MTRDKRTLGDGLKGVWQTGEGLGWTPEQEGWGAQLWDRPSGAGHSPPTLSSLQLLPPWSPLSTLSVGPSGWAWGGKGRGLCGQFALGKSLKVDQLVAGQLAH